jgi:hypothetical protein
MKLTFLTADSVWVCPCPRSRRKWPAKPGGRESRNLRVSRGHGNPERTAGERAWVPPDRARAGVNYWALGGGKPFGLNSQISQPSFARLPYGPGNWFPVCLVRRSRYMRPEARGREPSGMWSGFR